MNEFTYRYIQYLILILETNRFDPYKSKFCLEAMVFELYGKMLHCKSSSRNLSGFYSCPSAICSPVVFYGIIRCTQRIFVTFTTQREARIATQKM